MDKEKLAELVARVKSGDGEAMNDIFSATADIVYYFCSNVLGRAAESDVNKIYNMAEKNISSLDDDGKFLAWLRALTLKYCSDSMKIASDEAAWDISAADGLDNVKEAAPDDILNPAVYGDAIKSAVPSMMVDMTPSERICAYSYYYFGMSDEQIASIIGVSKESVEVKLKAVRFGIKTNMRFYANLSDEEGEELTFSRQLIRDFLFNDASKKSYSAKRRAAEEQNERVFSFAQTQTVPKAQSQMSQSQHQPRQPVTHQSAQRRNAPQPSYAKSSKAAEEEAIRLAHETYAAPKKEKKPLTQKQKNIILISAGAAVLVALIVCIIVFVPKIINGGNPNIEEVALKKLSFEQELVTLKLGETTQLKLVFDPENVTHKDVKWQFLDNEETKTKETSDVVSFDPSTGMIKAKAVGVTKIAAVSLKYMDYSENPEGELIVAMCEVRVDCIPELMEFKQNDKELEPGATFNLADQLIVSPSDAKNYLKWDISSATETVVAEINDKGVVTAKNEGIAIVTVSSSDGTKFKTFTVIVKKKQIPAEKIILDKESLTLEIGDTAKLTATVTPSNTTDGDVTWYSNDESIVTVDENGNITAVSAGNTAVAAYCGKTAVGICNITVNEKKISVESILGIDKNVKVGEMIMLNELFSILPSTATDRMLNYSILTGKDIVMEFGTEIIYCLKPGVIVVGATSSNGQTGVASITVTAE